MIDLLQKVIFVDQSKTWWFCVFLMTILTVFMVLRYKIRRTITLADRIPGPRGTFLLGMVPILYRGIHNLFKNSEKLYRMYENQLCRLWLFNRLVIILTRPEEIEIVLTNPKLIKKSKEYLVVKESVMGQGIFSIDDINKWKSNRKMVSSGFSFKTIKSFVPIFCNEAEVLNDILQKSRDLNSENCELSGPISRATMDMVGKTALDFTFNAQKGDHHPFIENLNTVMLTWEYRISHPWYLSKMLFWFSTMYKLHNQSQKAINKFTDEIINKKMYELNQNDQYSEELEVESDNIFQKPKTVIEILLGNYHEMTHEQVRDELITIMIGGQETTALANACAIFMLAHHQDVQNKVYEELQLIFSSGDENRQPTYEDLQQMEYLERVIKETLRLFPPIPLFCRSLDDEMKIGKYLCPAGSTLAICPLFLHSGPHFNTDPKKFNPDNFSPDMCRSRHPYSYIPFSAGLRNCIGIKYGMIQMKTILSTLVRRNQFFPSEKCPTPESLDLMYLTTLKFVNKCYVKIVPRIS